MKAVYIDDKEVVELSSYTLQDICYFFAKKYWTKDNAIKYYQNHNQGNINIEQAYANDISFLKKQIQQSIIQNRRNTGLSYYSRGYCSLIIWFE